MYMQGKGPIWIECYQLTYMYNNVRKTENVLALFGYIVPCVSCINDHIVELLLL